MEKRGVLFYFLVFILRTISLPFRFVLKYFNKKESFESEDTYNTGIIVGDFVVWRKSLIQKKEVFKWFEQNFGLGPFEVTGKRENNSKRTLYLKNKDGHVIPYRPFVLLLKRNRRGPAGEVGDFEAFEEQLILFKFTKTNSARK